MDRRNAAAAAISTNSAMTDVAQLRGTVAFSELGSLEFNKNSERKPRTVSDSVSAARNLQQSVFDEPASMVEVGDYDPSSSRGYRTGWKPKKMNQVIGTSVSKSNDEQLTSTTNRQVFFNQDTDQHGIVSQSSETMDRSFKSHADTTRRSTNSDSDSSHFDQFDSEGVCMIKEEKLSNGSSSEPVSCSVCGDTVAGFHCGAYVCEACKKFFVRCLKQDAGLRFTCAHNKSCEITKETRTQCPCCRFQKCLKLGMYRPGGPNVSSEIGHIPCKVCGAPSSGFHFGAITCEGCKGFFRRTVKERDSLKYQCSRNSSCVITWKTRNICKMCRYRACLKAGMKPDKSRIGRQPNSVKHATMLELNQIKSAKGLAIMPFPAREFKSEPDDFLECGNSMMTTATGLSNQGETIAVSISETLVNGDSVAINGRSNFLDRQENANRLKTENLVESYDAQTGRGNNLEGYKDVNPYELHGKKYPAAVPAPLPPELFALQQSQHVLPTTTEFNNIDPQLGLDSCKSFNSPTRDRDLFCEKFQPLDNGPVLEAYADFVPSFTATKPISPVMKPSSPLPDYETVISTIQHSYKDLSSILTRSDADIVTASSTMVTIWDNMMTQFAHCAQATLRFAKKVPGFRKFSISEQIHMVQSSMFPIVVVVLSLVYDLENQRFCYFMYSFDEMCHILRKFEPFQLLVPVMHHMGHKVRQLALDETEVAFLCALHLMDSGNKLTYKELLLDSLEEYIKRKFGQICDRNGQILLCLRDMVSTNHIHQQAVSALLCEGSKYSDLEIPQLFKESFIALDD